MATIAENIQTLRSIKSDIKNAIIQKGGSVTDAFGTYAQAITNLPSGGGGGTEIEDALITRTLSGSYYNNRVNMIGNGAFNACTSLISIDLPNCISILDFTFCRCSALTSIDLPLCSHIGTYGAFSDCSSLISINIPKCMYIGIYGFYRCTNLKEVYLNSVTSVTKMENNTFSKCPNLTSVYVPSSLVDAFKTAQYWSSISRKMVAYTGA